MSEDLDHSELSVTRRGGEVSGGEVSGEVEGFPALPGGVDSGRGEIRMWRTSPKHGIIKSPGCLVLAVLSWLVLASITWAFLHTGHGGSAGGPASLIFWLLGTFVAYGAIVAVFLDLWPQKVIADQEGIAWMERRRGCAARWADIVELWVLIGGEGESEKRDEWNRVTQPDDPSHHAELQVLCLRRDCPGSAAEGGPLGRMNLMGFPLDQRREIFDLIVEKARLVPDESCPGYFIRTAGPGSGSGETGGDREAQARAPRRR